MLEVAASDNLETRAEQAGALSGCYLNFQIARTVVVLNVIRRADDLPRQETHLGHFESAWGSLLSFVVDPS